MPPLLEASRLPTCGRTYLDALVHQVLADCGLWDADEVADLTDGGALAVEADALGESLGSMSPAPASASAFGTVVLLTR